MKNTSQLSDFLSFVKQTNDNYRIVCSIGQVGNIYRWLKTLGFGRVMVDGKLVTFRRTADYRFIPLRELSGTIMQVEKYVFFLNRGGAQSFFRTRNG